MPVPVYNEYFHKFKGGYSRTSEAGIANTKYILSHLINDYGWTFTSVCGILGNIQEESALNPNRPQTNQEDYFPAGSGTGGRVGGNYGFGLVQWTPWYRAYNDDWHPEGDLTPENGDGMGHPTYYYWCLNVYGTGKATASENNPIGLMPPQLRYLSEVPWGYSIYSRWRNDGYYYPYNWDEFKLIATPEEASDAWLFNYERPNSVSGKKTTLERMLRTLNARRSNARWYYDTYYDEFGSGAPHPPQPTPTRRKSNFIILAYGSGLFK